MFSALTTKRLPAAFTLIEMVIGMAILAILLTVVTVIVRPFDRIEKSAQQRAITELGEIAKAVQLFSLDEGYYPADVNRNVPPGISKYLTSEISWPEGPIPGTVYDYDNWSNQTCTDPEASGSIQITLRQIPGRNPDGSNVWAWYYPIFGKGSPHCNDANQWNKGECVSCPGFEL